MSSIPPRRDKQSETEKFVKHRVFDKSSLKNLVSSLSLFEKQKKQQNKKQV